MTGFYHRILILWPYFIKFYLNFKLKNKFIFKNIIFDFNIMTVFYHGILILCYIIGFWSYDHVVSSDFNIHNCVTSLVFDPMIILYHGISTSWPYFISGFWFCDHIVSWDFNIMAVFYHWILILWPNISWNHVWRIAVWRLCCLVLTCYLRSLLILVISGFVVVDIDI